MALTADQAADANSNLEEGVGSQTKRFTMPGNKAMKIESVVATINNGAGSAVTPEITIRDQSGVVIAAHKQDASIPAGDTGTATYALRLSASTGTAAGFIKYDFLNTGDWLVIETTTALTPGGFGQEFTANHGGFGFSSTGFVNSQFSVTADFVIFNLGNNIFRVINASSIDLNTASLVVSASSDVNLATSNANLGIDSSDAVNINLANNQPLTVFDNSGNPIFRVDEDGDLHGLTGKALTFDL